MLKGLKKFESVCARIHCPFCRGSLEEHSDWRLLVSKCYSFPEICPFGVIEETARAYAEATRITVRKSITWPGKQL